MIRFTITMCFTLLIAFTSAYAQGCDPNNLFYEYNSFETGWGDWNKGGVDCVRAGAYATNGNYSVRLRDNSGAASSVYSDPFDLTSTNQAVLNFQYTQTGFEFDENFKIQVSIDGINYTTVRTFAAGHHFDHYDPNNSNESNSTAFGPYSESIVIDFPFSATTSFRIMCNASDNQDKLFIDHLTIATELCNDGLSNTINDIYGPFCICWGSYIDNDGDGEPASTDPNDYNPCIPNDTDLQCLQCGDPVIEEDFNNGWGTWNDGGADAFLTTIGGYDVAAIRDNSGVASSIYSDDALFNQKYVVVNFNYYAVGMEPGENFFLEYSFDGGTNYTIVKSFVSGIHFYNNQIMTERLEIKDDSFTGQTTRFRFRCDASANNDVIYIDDIEIEDCNISQPRLANPIQEEELELIELDVEIYPNPVKNASFLTYAVSDYSAVQTIEIYSIDGQLLQNSTWEEGQSELLIDIENYKSGTYITILKTVNGPITNKFIVMD